MKVVRSERLVALLLVSTLAACQGHGTDLRYTTAPVTRGTIVSHVTASGTLGALVSVDVGSQVSGKIAAVHADFNAVVTKGQLIAEIDPAVYSAALAQAEGDLESAAANAVLKAANLERKKVLFPQHAASQLDLDQAVAELAQAKAAVEIKRAIVASARANLGYCRITSPVDGIVISRKVDAGQTVAATMTTPVLFTIAQDIRKMNISAAVSEADIGQVKDGQPVDFSVDAYPNVTFHGTVVQVRKAPVTKSNVVTYETIIGVDNPDMKLFPGMTADVSILVARHADVALVPNAALRFVPPDGAAFEGEPPRHIERSERLVYTVDAATQRLRTSVVSIGLSDGESTEILSGPPPGTDLVTAAVSGEGAPPGTGPLRPRGPPPS